MNYEQEIIFGDPSKFALRFYPETNCLSKPGNFVYGFVHMIIGGKLIGTSEESCDLYTWMGSASIWLENIRKYQGDFSYPITDQLNNEDLFNIFTESNSLKEYVESKFPDLPKLDSRLFSLHRVHIDETIDAYTIICYESNHQLKFIWKGWHSPCPKEEIGQLNSFTVEYPVYLEAMDGCMEYLTNYTKAIENIRLLPLMQKFKKNISEELQKNKFEIVEVNNSQNKLPWWIEEYWIATKQPVAPHNTFFITFLTDKHWERGTKFVSEIRVSYKKLKSYDDLDYQITALDMRKGNFEEKLIFF